MQQRRDIVLAAIVILLGLSVVVTESGALAYLPEGWWLRFLQPLSGLLFAIAGFLSWRYYQLTNNVFFKILAIALFIHAGTTLEGVLPVLINYPLSMPGQLSVFLVLHTLLQLTGSFLFAILLVYAIMSYKGYERPLSRGLLIAVIGFVVLFTAWRIGVLIWTPELSNTIDHVFMLSSSVLFAVIYFDGIRMALAIIKATGSRLLKWLVAVMVLEISLSLAWIFPWLLFYSGFSTQIAIYYNYAITAIIISIPILLLTALVVCEKEYQADVCP